jgi:hypothetical protein
MMAFNEIVVFSRFEKNNPLKKTFNRMGSKPLHQQWLFQRWQSNEEVVDVEVV